MRDWRKNNPLKCRYAWIRERAHKKGIPFTITLEDFYFLEEVSGPITSRHHIDRKIPEKGYTPTNCQVLLKRENIAKGNRERGKQTQLF